MDRNGFGGYQETTPDSINETKTFVNSVFNMKSDLVEPIITPRFVPTCTKELLNSLGEIADEHNLRIQTHLSECKPELAWVKELEPWAIGQVSHQHLLFKRFAVRIVSLVTFSSI